jgi:ABC-type multidrug transport system ATPase subunit
MNLRMNGDNLAGRFSGGNKRKLMVACSLIGNPKAILLDEPSTGMDPEAKRFMWNSISKFKKGSGVVMTTHSMDEAEALADYLGIMKQGEFKFIGTLMQLRSM